MNVANQAAGGATVKRGLPALLQAKYCPSLVSRGPRCTLLEELGLTVLVDPDVMGLWFGVEHAIYTAAEGLQDETKSVKP